MAPFPSDLQQKGKWFLERGCDRSIGHTFLWKVPYCCPLAVPLPCLRCTRERTRPVCLPLSVTSAPYTSFLYGERRGLPVSGEPLYLVPLTCVCLHCGYGRCWAEHASNQQTRAKSWRCLEMVWCFLMTFCNSASWYMQSGNTAEGALRGTPYCSSPWRVLLCWLTSLSNILMWKMRYSNWHQQSNWKNVPCPMRASDKISKVGPDILLDCLCALFLPSKIGKFNRYERNVSSLVNTGLIVFVCITNMALNILTVLLDEGRGM